MAEMSLAGRCGMYCGSCPLYRASHDFDDKKVSELSASTGCAVDRVRCEGCGSADRFVSSCAVRKCAEGKGLESCALCPEFPCEALEGFWNKDRMLRGEAAKNARRIREVGTDKWLGEMDARWRCRHCDSKTAHDMKACRVCKALINPPRD